jgi:hypothetical protein
MNDPITVDIPHKLGLAAARAKIEKGIGKFASFVPGGAVTEQRVASRLDVMETRVHATFDLPPMLRLFAGKIHDKLTESGKKLLK